MAAPVFEEYMGYHLLSDTIHDFKGDALIYNIKGTDAATQVGATSTSEDQTVRFFLEGPGAALINDLAARQADAVTFTVPDKTASFDNWKPPLLYPAGNDHIGIIQDAGEYITTRIGSKNVLAFGSILDPAGKPNHPAHEPIWFEPEGQNQVEIPLNLFGFDADVVRTIGISGLTAGTVKAAFGKPDGTYIDAVAMSPPLPEIGGGKAKPLNNTKIEKAGFFTSIEKASNLPEQLDAAGITNPARAALLGDYRKFFFIGKTLGDAMLVASAMPAFGEGIPNPYFNVAGSATVGTWKTWITQAPIAAPDILILKTGDRLNWLRAILFNVGAIYEDQAKGGRKTKQYKYFPGTADPVQIRAALLADFDTMKTTVQTRYADLVKSMESLIATDGLIDTTKTNFAPGGDTVVKTPNGRAQATRLLSIIAGGLFQSDSAAVTFCNIVLNWIDTRKTIAASIDISTSEGVSPLRAFYQDTLNRANACSPQSSSLFIQKGKQDPYLTHKLVVANVPSGVTAGEWPFPSSLDIAVRNAFLRLNGAKDQTDEEFNRLIEGTDIYNRFLTKLPGPVTGGGLRGGQEEAPLDLSSIEETVTEVVGDIQDSEGIPPMEGGQRGGAFLTPRLYYPADEFDTVLAESFPQFYDFRMYLKSKGFSLANTILIAYDIARRRTTNRILDPILLEDLLNELYSLLGGPWYDGDTPTQYIGIEGADMGVFTEAYTVDKNMPSSRATVLFDAYTYYVNAQNARLVEGGDTLTQSVRDFQVFETIYLEKVGITRLRSGTAVFPGGPVQERKSPKAAALPTAQGLQQARMDEARRRSQTAREKARAQRRGVLASIAAQSSPDADGDESMAPQGGSLQTRRALYSNDVAPQRASARRGLYERLQQRSGPRRTARVRQPARKSRTRRHRKHLDRV